MDVIEYENQIIKPKIRGIKGMKIKKNKSILSSAKYLRLFSVMRLTEQV